MIDSVAARSSREWIAAALRGEAVSPDLDGFDAEALVAAAEDEHVLPLLEWRLRNGDGWQASPEAFRKALVDGSRLAAMQSMLRENEQQRISRVLAESGIRALLLKGNALGFWLYPQPYLRQTSDIDLLFASRAAAHRAAEALSVLGYGLAFNPGSMNYEMTCRPGKTSVSRSDIDLHCRLINSIFYADIFGFEELWNSSFPLDGINESLKALAPIHAVANACMNRALDLQIGVPDRLKLLYDIHLMLGRMQDAAWTDFIAMAKAKGICGVCLRSIEDTVTTFATQVPASAMDEMHRHTDAEPLDWRRLDDWRYMQWQNLKALPTWRARVVWLYERLLPTRSHLQELHGSDAGMAGLLWRRIKRGFVRVGNRG